MFAGDQAPVVCPLIFPFLLSFLTINLLVTLFISVKIDLFIPVYFGSNIIAANTSTVLYRPKYRGNGHGHLLS